MKTWRKTHGKDILKDFSKQETAMNKKDAKQTKQNKQNKHTIILQQTTTTT